MLYYDKNNFFEENKKEINRPELQIEELYENNNMDDKLSFMSPTSMGILNINGRKRLSQAFNEQKEENSISVSNIEEMDLPNQSQTRIEIQELQNEEADQE